MTVTDQQIRDVVERYVKLVGSGPPDEIVKLFAEGAVVEDPAGSEPRRNPAAIRELYALLDNGLEKTSELIAVRVVGNVAVFLFKLTTLIGDKRMELSPIDMMEFDDDGNIRSMKAYWSQDDLIFG